MVDLTLIDKRTEREELPPEVLKRSWYRMLSRSLPLCVLPLHWFDVSVVYVDPAEMRTLNKRYRGLARVTDVLSFKYANYGEIIICPGQALRQRRRFCTTPTQEFARLFFHGILHLYGYDHITISDRKNMQSLEHCLMMHAAL